MDTERRSPTLALVRRARSAELRLAGILDPHGLTVRKHDVLRAIAATPGLSRGELARKAQIDVAGVPTLVRALVEAGLVRERVPAGGHASLLAATEKAAVTLGTIDADLAALDDELFGDLDGAEIAAALLAESARPAPAPQD